MKLISNDLKLTIKEYKEYKKIHTFLLSGEKNN